MKLEFYRQIFEKHQNIIFNENPSSGRQLGPCERREKQTQMTKLIAVFLNFGNAAKKGRQYRPTYNVTLRYSRITILVKDKQHCVQCVCELHFTD